MIYWHDENTNNIDYIFLCEKIVSYKREVSVSMRSYVDKIKFTNSYYVEFRIDNVSHGYHSFGLYKESETLGIRTIFRYTTDHLFNGYFIKKYIKYFHDKVKQLDRNSFTIEATVERYFE